MKKKIITHKQITESDPYQPDNVPLYEIIYGKNLISLGGTAAIDNMFSDLTIQGLKALDIGFGLGGVAFYLAKQYQMEICGIEIHPWMVSYAKEHTPPHLLHPPEFTTYHSSGEIPYAPETFDLVYSKGVLNHVSDKSPLFQQIFKILKSDGLLVIADWIYPHKTTNQFPLVCETKISYEQVLHDCGFPTITFRDDSKQFLEYTKLFFENLIAHRKLIEEKYNDELYSIIQKQHETLIEQLQHQQKFAVRIVAKKTT